LKAKSHEAIEIELRRRLKDADRIVQACEHATVCAKLACQHIEVALQEHLTTKGEKS